MDFCLKNNFSNVCIFSDSLLAIRAIIQPLEEFGLYEVIVLEVEDLLKALTFLSIIHMRRSTNEVAHNLAHYALHADSNLELTNSDIPCWTQNVVNKDFFI